MKELATNQSVKDFRESNFKSFNQSQASLHATRKLNMMASVDDNLPSKKNLPAPTM